MVEIECLNGKMAMVAGWGSGNAMGREKDLLLSQSSVAKSDRRTKNPSVSLRIPDEAWPPHLFPSSVWDRHTHPSGDIFPVGWAEKKPKGLCRRRVVADDGGRGKAVRR